MDFTDKATSIRNGESLDRKKVESFLKDAIPGLNGELDIRQFPGGYSNLTYLLTIGNREMVLRRPPFGTKAKSAHDMSREFRVLTALYPVFPYCPKPLAYSEDPAVIGCPFYVMERLNGIILRKNLPDGLTLTPPQAGKLCNRFLEVLVELHRIDYKAAGLESFGKPDGYIHRQVTGWSDRYRAARTEDAPDFRAVMAWIKEKMPADAERPSLIHNDYRLDNIVLDRFNPEKIIGVLDWEMAAVGDPLMDLGNTLAYWVEPDDPDERKEIRMTLTHLPGFPTRAELVRRYREKSGRSFETFDFYYCFGMFRLAVIAQQIYYRYFHGQTQDKRFGMLIFVVHILERAAVKVMEGSKL